MSIQGKLRRHIGLTHLQLLVSIGLMPLGIGSFASRVEGKPPLPSVCVGIAPLQQPQSTPTTLQKQCCQAETKAQCKQWQQLFPEPERPSLKSVKRPPVKPADVFVPRLDEYGNSIGSEGAAKDAVIQVGVTKALDALGSKLNSSNTSSKTGHHLNFFERVRKDYERILGPRELKSGAILTPQIGMNMNLGRFNMDSMKFGVDIKF